MLDEKRFIVVSAVCQRTGSTLIQRILNYRDKTLIWGEHGGVISNLCNIKGMLGRFSDAEPEKRREFLKSDKPYQMGTQNVSPANKYVDKSVEKATKVLLDNLYSQDSNKYDMIGFKEVRYGRDELELLDSVLDNLKVVLLVRNPIDVKKSVYNHWKLNNNEVLVERWNDRVDDYLELIDLDNFYFIKYEDVVKRKDSVIEKLYEIGEVGRKGFKEVVNVKINSTSSEINQNDKREIKEKCRKNMKKLDYI